MKITEITQQTNEGPWQGVKDFAKKASLLPKANLGGNSAMGQQAQMELAVLERSKLLTSRFMALMKASGTKKNEITPADLTQYLKSAGIDTQLLIQRLIMTSRQVKEPNNSHRYLAQMENQ